MKIRLFLASALLLSAAAFGQKTAAAARKTEFIVKDAQSGQPLNHVEVEIRQKKSGATNDEGIVKLSVKKGDTVIFWHNYPLTNSDGTAKSYKEFTFVVPEKNDFQPQEILMKSYDILQTAEASKAPLEDNEIYRVPDEQASFPGGMQEMRAYIVKNIVYPENAVEEMLEGKSFIRFVVAKDGTISHLQLMRGVQDCRECDQEAIRLIKSMPKWIPAKVKGKAVNSYYTLPIVFKLNRG